MVDLTKKPFYLSETDISWVEETIRSMSPEEKIGQLFIMLDRKKRRFFRASTSADAVIVTSRQSRFMSRTVSTRKTVRFRC